MPDSSPGRPLTVVADLHFEVSDDEGSTTAHLTSEHEGLVLDVDHLSTILRCVPGRGLTRDLPVAVPRHLFAGARLRLTSRGRDLGRVRLSPRGRIRLRPTGSGVLVAVRTAGSSARGRTVSLALATLAALFAGVTAWARRRREQG